MPFIELHSFPSIAQKHYTSPITQNRLHIHREVNLSHLYLIDELERIVQESHFSLLQGLKI